MKFSKTTEYALRILVFMAADEDKRQSSSDLFAALKIPKKYLQQLLTVLSKKGLLDGNKGKYGGFMLTRRASNIFIADVVNAVEGLSEKFTCIFGLGECALREPCPLHNTWTAAQSNVRSVLSTTRLSDLIRK